MIIFIPFALFVEFMAIRAWRGYERPWHWPTTIYEAWQIAHIALGPAMIVILIAYLLT